MPQWKDVDVNFRGSSSALGDAMLQVAAAASIPGQMLKDREAQKRYEAELARQKVLDDRATAEYNRKMQEQEAKDLFAKGLLEGPKTTYADMNQWPGATGEKLVGMEVYSNKDAAGNTVYTDKSGRVLSEPERLAREKKQLELGAVVDTPGIRNVETRPELLSRIIAEAGEKNLPVTGLVSALEEARAAELTTQEKEKTGAQAKVDAAKKALLDLEGAKNKTFLEYGLEKPKTVVGGSIVTKEDEEFGTKAQSKAAQEAYKSKKDALKGLTGSAAVEAKKALEDEVVGWGTSLAGMFGASDKAKIQEYMQLTKDIAAPEVAANYARLYGKDEGFFEDSLKDPKALRDGLLQYVASLDKEDTGSGYGASGRGTSLSQTQNQFQQVGDKLSARSVADMYSGQEKFLQNELRKAEESLRKASMTPEERKAAQFAKVDSTVKDILDWRYAESTKPDSTVPTKAPTEKETKALTKVLASVENPKQPSTTAEKKAAVKAIIPDLKLTPEQKERVINDIKVGQGKLTAKDKAMLAKWEKEASGEIKDELLGPITDVLFGRLLKGTLDNPAVLRKDPIAPYIDRGLNWARGKLGQRIPTQFTGSTPPSSTLNLQTPAYVRRGTMGPRPAGF